MNSRGASKFINQVEPYITDHERKAVAAYMRSGGWLTEHERTREFERRIAEFVGARYAVVVTSGTVALYLALLACGVGPGQSALVPDYTMIATPNSVRWAGAQVSLADVERNTLCLDLDALKKERRLRAVMYVSMNGRASRLDELAEFCSKNNLCLIEDAAQSLGSRWHGKFLGTFGDAGIFSFTPHKIITTGQGGAVVTNRADVYEKIKSLKDFCRTEPGVDSHTEVGFNFKFTDIQAVIGIEQIKHIDFRMKRRREIYRWYREELEGSDAIEFLPTDLHETVPWFADVLLKVPRERVIASLKECGIGSRPFYPPIHSQAPYRGVRGHFEVASDVCYRGLWLPSSIGLARVDFSRVAKALRDAIRQAAVH